MRRGVFITIEGIDGTGKSTQSHRLAEALRDNGKRVVLTREPGGAPGAEEIRRLLVEGDPGRWSPETEMLLFTAARRDHVERVIRPALDKGQIVICDRYVDSTRAYQGADSEERRVLVDQLHDLTINLDSDLTLIFDMPARTASDRVFSRTETHGASREDRFERKGVGFQERLRSAFHLIAREEPERCRVIDASAPPDRVFDDVWRIVERTIAEQRT